MERLRNIFFVLLVLTILASCTSQKQTESKPNIVFILADDCSYYDIGSYGSKDAITPNIDQLALDGMKFNKCWKSVV